MSDYRDLLEQERRRHRMPHGSMEELERRRDRRRRNRRIASGLVALVIAVAGIGVGVFALRPTGEGKPAVSPTPSVTPPTGSKALPAPSGPIQFVDAQNGWAVGPNAEILATKDGGANWTPQYSDPMKIVAVQFVDRLHGWAVGESGLLRTVDGGSSWSPITDQAFSSVQFVNARAGWAISYAAHGPPGTLWMSSDGGETWLRSGLGLAADSVCAVDDSLVWAAGASKNGFVLEKSVDGGRTWTESSIQVPQGEPWTATVRCAGIDAWVLVQDGGAAGHLPYALFHTTNGGPNSVPVLQEAGTRPLGDVKGVRDAPDPYPGPLVAFSGEEALFVGWCPACGNSMALYATSDAVRNWDRSELVKQGGTPLGMSFADRHHGWILIMKGDPPSPKWTVMATTDGGKTWSTLP